MAKFRRVSDSVAGPVAFSVANFALAMVLQQSISADGFGLFAFVQIVVAAAMGLSNGLFSSPLNVLLASNTSAALISSFRIANSIFCVVSAGVTALLAVLAGAKGLDSMLFSALAGSVLLRWFQRSAMLATGKRPAAHAMDITYAIAIAFAVASLWLFDQVTLLHITCAQTIASLISMAPACCGREGETHSRPTLAPFAHAFVAHGKWALSANAASQLAVNVHAYVITLVLGTAAFAPVAVATLMFRPLGVVLTGLVQFEQPRMAKRIAAKQVSVLDGDVRFVGRTAKWVWVANVAVILAIPLLVPTLIETQGYDPLNLGLSVALTGLVVLIRALREPKATALQAGGRFREIAVANVICVPISLLASLTLATWFPLISALALLGSLLGECVSFAIVRRRFGALRQRLAIAS